MLKNKNKNQKKIIKSHYHTETVRSFHFFILSLLLEPAVILRCTGVWKRVLLLAHHLRTISFSSRLIRFPFRKYVYRKYRLHFNTTIMVWVHEKRVDGVLIIKKVKYLEGLFSLPTVSILLDCQDFDRNFNIYEWSQVDKIRICAKWLFNGTCGLSQAGEYLTRSRFLVSRDKRKKASEKKG